MQSQALAAPDSSAPVTLLGEWWSAHPACAGMARGALTGESVDMGRMGGVAVVGPMHPTYGYMMRHVDGSVTGPVPENLVRMAQSAHGVGLDRYEGARVPVAHLPCLSGIVLQGMLDRLGLDAAAPVVPGGLLRLLAQQSGASLRRLGLPDADRDITQATAGRIAIAVEARLDALVGDRTVAGLPATPERMLRSLARMAREQRDSPASVTSESVPGSRLSSAAPSAPPSAQSSVASVPQSAASLASAVSAQREGAGGARRIAFADECGAALATTEGDEAAPPSVAAWLVSALPAEAWPRFAQCACELLNLPLGAGLRDIREYVYARIDTALGEGAMRVARRCSPQPPDTPDRAVMLLSQIAAAQRNSAVLRGGADAGSTWAGTSAPDAAGGMRIASAAAAAAAAMSSDSGKGDAAAGDDSAREAGLVEALVGTLSIDEAGKAQLSELSQAAMLEDYKKLRKAFGGVTNSNLRKLLSSSASVAGLALEHPKLMRELQAVRSGLEDMALRAGAGESAIRSSTFRAQLSYVRLGRWSKLRLAKLMGKQDKRSESALHFLEDVQVWRLPMPVAHSRPMCECDRCGPVEVEGRRPCRRTAWVDSQGRLYLYCYDCMLDAAGYQCRCQCGGPPDEPVIIRAAVCRPCAQTGRAVPGDRVRRVPVRRRRGRR